MKLHIKLEGTLEEHGDTHICLNMHRNCLKVNRHQKCSGFHLQSRTSDRWTRETHLPMCNLEKNICHHLIFLKKTQKNCIHKQSAINGTGSLRSDLRWTQPRVFRWWPMICEFVTLSRSFNFIYAALTKAFWKYWNIFSEIVLIAKFKYVVFLKIKIRVFFFLFSMQRTFK